MKKFLSYILFGVLSLGIIIFLIVMIYKTLRTNESIEKSKYEDVVVEKVNGTIDKAKQEGTNLVNKVLPNGEIINDTDTSLRVLAEKSYQSINEEVEALSSYSGYFIGNDGNIYAFYINGSNEFMTLPCKERNDLMVANSKLIDSIVKDDLIKIKLLINKLNISYDEEENSDYESGAFDKTKMFAVYDYKRNERISLTEEGKYIVKNNSEDADNLIYLLGKYLKYYMLSYSDFENY